MTVERDCERGDDPVDSSKLRRCNYASDSSVLSHSHDVPGSSESIFSAIRVPTRSHRTERSGTAYQMGSLMEEGRAGDVAMFISSGSSGDPSFRGHNLSRRRGKTVEKVWWRSHMGSDQATHCLPESSSPTADTQPARRRAVSLDAASSNGPGPRWPGRIGSAVRTVRPLYPAPERLPTPPGLPSFNTPEAVYCSSQFLAGQGGRTGYNRSIPSDRQRATSYGDTFRRFFGLSPSSGPGPSNSSAVGIGRAEDGTAVLGRFPYRQSGHGINLTRQIQDHPFHQTAIPVAAGEAECDRYETDLEAASTKDAGSLARSGRDGRILTPPVRRLWLSPDEQQASTTANAASGRSPKPPRPIALLELSQTRSRQDTPSRASPSTGEVECFVQGVGLMGERDSSTSGQLQPVLDQTRSEERVNESSRGRYVVFDAVCWLPSHLYAHSCLGNRCAHESHEDLEGYDVVESADTFTTAREHQSGYWSWISSVYHWFRRRSLTGEPSPV